MKVRHLLVEVGVRRRPCLWPSARKRPRAQRALRESGCEWPKREVDREPIPGALDDNLNLEGIAHESLANPCIERSLRAILPGIGSPPRAVERNPRRRRL